MGNLTRAELSRRAQERTQRDDELRRERIQGQLSGIASGLMIAFTIIFLSGIANSDPFPEVCNRQPGTVYEAVLLDEVDLYTKGNDQYVNTGKDIREMFAPTREYIVRTFAGECIARNGDILINLPETDYFVRAIDLRRYTDKYIR